MNQRFELNPERLKERKTEDSDLITPEHDELMVSLLSKDLWKKLFTRLGLLERIYSKSDLEYYRNRNEQLDILKIEAEVPVTNWNKQIVGYIDLLVSFGFGGRYRNNIACEIKATEPFLGSVIRQINKYRHYTHFETWLVVSPYSEWEEPLRSQDILWISAQSVLAGEV
jgi:hypothetical protein